MSLILLLVASVVGFLTVVPRPGLDGKIASIVKPYSFSISAWEFRTITRQEIPRLFRRENTGDVAPVIEYFTNARQVRSLEAQLSEAEAGAPVNAAPAQAQLDSLRKQQRALADRVEATIEQQIADTLRAEGIYNPSGLLRLSFPPVNFEMARPPSMLVVSPRDRIESIEGATLQPDLPVDRAEEIESRVDKLNVSSLVTGIGGLGATYPTFVADDMDLKATINSAAHEWVHQYLLFRPLGFLYALDVTGIDRDRDIRSMNETLADIIGNEIGEMVYDKYYAPKLSAVSDQQSGDSDEESKPEFDFNAEMRAIRQQVDSLLSQGKVDDAERYMNERRDYLASHGYYIRKLNQAYFAFYGSYTDSPTSVDPIGAEMKQLRSESKSLKQFLEKASGLRSAEQLKKEAGAP
jgi:hypothetical protein